MMSTNDNTLEKKIKKKRDKLDDNKLDKLDENMNNMNLSVNKIEDKSVESQSSIFFKKGDKYLKKFLTTEEYDTLSKNLKIVEENNTDKTNIADEFTTEYRNIVKKKYQLEDSPNYNKELYNFVKNNNKKVKILWGNCLDHLKNLPSESIHLMVTSPPYYNARDYSIWENLQKYLDDMRIIIKESYRVLDNHRVFVFNIGDIFGNDNMTVKSVWGKRRLPLSAYLIKIFEECGFTFVDDFIWNKGEPQSQRQFSPPYPLYQYPVNSYEHILIFHKHRLDKTKFPCSVCGCLHVSGNSQSEIGVQSWECKNPDCTQKSKSNRGKRFSLKTIITQIKKRNKQEKKQGIRTETRREPRKEARKGRRKETRKRNKKRNQKKSKTRKETRKETQWRHKIDKRTENMKLQLSMIFHGFWRISTEILLVGLTSRIMPPRHGFY